MDRDKVLKEIFDNDPLGLLVIKPTNSSGRNEDERLVASFQEINNGNGSESAPRQNDSLEYKTKVKEADSLKMIKDIKTTPISTPSVKSNKDDTVLTP